MALVWPTDDSSSGSGVSAAALHSLLSSGGGGGDAPEWNESEWGDMLNASSEAFTRALQQAEMDLEEQSGEHCSQSAGAASIDTDAFQHWAQRIAHLQILNVSALAVANLQCTDHKLQSLPDSAHS